MVKSLSEIMSDMDSKQVQKAFEQVYGQDNVETVEPMTDEVKVKENKVKSKTVELQPQLKFQYEFTPVVDENSGTIQYGTFDFANVFKGMSEAFDEIHNEWEKFKSDKGKYSKEYVNTQRDQLFVDVMELKSRYQTKYRESLKQLKSPTKTQQVMSYTDEQTNELKRANNIKMMEHFINHCSMKQLYDLYHYQNNKEVYDVVMMLLTRLHLMAEVETDGNVKRAIDKLKNEIHLDLAKRANPNYYTELEKIEFNLNHVFNQEKFPVGLEKGFNNIQYKAILP